MTDNELKLFDSYARSVINAIAGNPFIMKNLFDTISEDAADDWIAERTIQITKKILSKREELKREDTHWVSYPNIPEAV